MADRPELSRPGGGPAPRAPFVPERWIFRDLAPASTEHRGWGFRAIVQCLALPERPQILDIGAGGFLGETTTVHLLDLPGARIDAVEINPDRAHALQQKFGARIRVFAEDFATFRPPEPYDLIVFDLDSSSIAAQYERFLAAASGMLRRPHGKIINSLIYDSAEAFNDSGDFLSPLGRADYEAFLGRYFGSVQLEPAMVVRRLAEAGFAVLGMVDKFMGVGGGPAARNAIGWLVLEPIG